MDDDEDDDDYDGSTKKVGDSEEVQVRDVRYQLETLVTTSFPSPCFFPRNLRTFSHVASQKKWFPCEEAILRTELAVKERNLRVRGMTWVFDPASWLPTIWKPPVKIQDHVFVLYEGFVSSYGNETTINNVQQFGDVGVIWDHKETKITSKQLYKIVGVQC